MHFRLCRQSIGKLAIISTVVASTAILPSAAPLYGDEPAPRTRGEAAPRDPGVPRAGGGQRSAFGTSIPAALKLTDDQLAKIRAIEEQLHPQQIELAKKREAILTDEQKALRTELAQKARDAGAQGRQGQSVAELLKLTDEQKTQLAAIEHEGSEIRRTIETQVQAILTDEQKSELRKIKFASSAGRIFSVPGEITLTDDQKAKLKAIEDEMVPKFAALAEKEATIMTEERRAARMAAEKSLRESGKSLRDPGVAEEFKAALKLTDAERAQLEEIHKGQNELRQEAQTRRMELLTADQKEQLQKLNPPAPARTRN